jgi:hypothetical protein
MAGRAEVPLMSDSGKMPPGGHLAVNGLSPFRSINGRHVSARLGPHIAGV